MQPYRVVAEIDLEAIVQNFHRLNKHLPATTKVCAVVKADGYGHGAVPIAKRLMAEGVTTFAVATVHEAIDLRKNGISGKIIVLGYTPEAYLQEVLNHELTQTIFRLDAAIALSKSAKLYNKSCSIQLLLDTGMGRLGFYDYKQWVANFKQIQGLNNLSIDGIYSHFSRADEENQSYSEQQLKSFHCFIDALGQEQITIPPLHISNSAGAMALKDATFSMVRMGIALYGLYPSSEMDQSIVRLKPALSLKSQIIFLKKVPAGQSISYGGTFVTKRETVIATIPVGYGDGYPRQLSSKGHVIIRHQKVPIIGRICMDLMMVDVSDVHGVNYEDEVILIGGKGEVKVTVDEIAKHIGTINYEVVCQLGKRIPRVYK